MGKALTIIPKGDRDAVAIGKLWRAACTSLVDSGKYYIECGQKLEAKKSTLKHGEWLPWLAAHADALGFDTPRTAQLLIKGASNAKPASYLADETNATDISRKLWGHDNTRGTQGKGEN